MEQRHIGIIVHGATSRISTTQHLENALLPIRAEGGLVLNGCRVVPQPVLVGRNAERLEAIAARLGIADWICDLDAALARDDCEVLFDGAATHQRGETLRKAIAAGKHIYSEKPVALTVEEGARLLKAAEAAGIRHAVVEDKLYLPGMQKLARLVQFGFFGAVTHFQLEFGWWVFDGNVVPCQRPSWNYRRSEGGGLLLDMYSHWRYVVEGVLGRIKRVVSVAWTATKERVDEHGVRYPVDVEDSAVALVELESGAFGTIQSSWATRVRRDELLSFQIDGTRGSAVAGLHRCYIQPLESTPKVHWSPNEDLHADYASQWHEVPDLGPYKNSYRVGWEAFLSHVVLGTPITSNLAAGIRDVRLAEACRRSVEEDSWISMQDTV